MRKTIAFLLLAGLGAAWAGPRDILVVESYHREYAWDHAYRQALSGQLGQQYALEFFEMDTKRLPVERHADMARKALMRVRALHPALVILGDDAAVKYLGPLLEPLGMPGVYLGMNANPRSYKLKNMTGVLERPLIKRSIVFIREVVPAAKKMLLLFDDGLTARITLEEFFGSQPSLDVDGIQVDLQMCSTVEAWKKAVRQAASNGYQVTIAGLYQTLRRPGGAVADAEEVIAWTSANTPVPLFALWDFAVGPDKAVGGLVLSAAEQGKTAATLALQILEGKADPSTMLPVTARQGDFIFSKSQLARFRLALPPDIASQARLLD